MTWPEALFGIAVMAAFAFIVWAATRSDGKLLDLPPDEPYWRVTTRTKKRKSGRLRDGR